MESTVKEINSITRSHHRTHVLRWLLDEGPLTIDEIRSRADASRTTVNRNLEALEERAWISRTNREYSLTPSGEIVAEKLFELINFVQITTRLRPIAEWLPAAALDIDIEALDDATVVTSRPTDPYAPVSRHIDAMATADEFRCVLPAVGLPAMRTAYERVIEDECWQEIIVPEDVLRTLTSTPTYRELLDDMLETGRLNVFMCEEMCQFYLGLTDTVIQIGVQDDEGMPRGLIELESHEARQWAEGIYERYMEHSRPYSLSTDGESVDSPSLRNVSSS